MATRGVKRKRHLIVLNEKAAILRRHMYNGEKINDLAKEFNIPQNTISTWKKHAEKIFKQASDSAPKRKIMRLSRYKDVELALLYWLKDMRSQDVPPPIDGPTMVAKAEK